MSDEAEETPPIQPGTVLAGKYRVERLLASGGMGSVVKARHEILEQDVAIKVMRPEIAKNVEFSQRFLREARAAAKIASDYVARVTDVDLLDDGTPFMVMEYLEGEDLAALLDRVGQLPIGEAVDYILQALSGLEAAHKLGIVHRDLKPSNLFLAERGHGGGRRVKVLDFGISKILEDRAPSGLKAGATTAYNAFLGTPRYMSPEQVSCAKDVDARTDVWSMGLILFNLLTGVDPFEADTFQGVFARILTEPVTSVREHRSDCPEELERVVLRCLERDRKQRIASAGEMMRALGPFASTRVRASLLDPNELAHGVETRIEIGGGAKDGERVSVPSPTPAKTPPKYAKDAPTAKLSPITPSGASAADVGDVASFSAERTVIAADPAPLASSFQQASTQAPLTAPASAPARPSRTPAIAAVAVVAVVGIGFFALRGGGAKPGDAASAVVTAEPSAAAPAALVATAVETASAEAAPSAAPTASASASAEAAAPSVEPAGSASAAPSASAQVAVKPTAATRAPHAGAAGAKKPSSSADDILGTRN